MTIPKMTNAKKVDTLLDNWDKEDQAFVGKLNGRAVKQITSPSLFKTWEIVICAITVIGLFVLLGLYYKRKNALTADQAREFVKRFSQESSFVHSEIKSILTMHKDWIPTVKTWKGISSEDKLWLLQVSELAQLGVSFGKKLKDIPNTVKALKILAEKAKIEEILLKITHFTLVKSFEKLPNSIYLLKNLRGLTCTNIGLKESPDVSQFPQLEDLFLGVNDLETPPDVSKNPKLIVLSLYNNKLKVAPDITGNPLLSQLLLDQNSLENPPDVTQNKELTILSLSENPFSSTLDLANNTKLQRLRLAGTDIDECPDISKNLELIELNLANTKIADFPPPRAHKKLQELDVTGIPLGSYYGTSPLQSWADDHNVTLTY